MKAAAVFSVLVLAGVSVWQVLPVNNDTDSESLTTPAAGAETATTQQEMMLLGLATSSDPSATSDIDPVSLIGPQVFAQLLGKYAGLSETGTYSIETGSEAAEQIAGNVKAAVSYKTFVGADIKLSQETTHERMLKYRSDLRDAFIPLLEIQGPEFEMFARYIETSDPEYLTQMEHTVDQYERAIVLTAQIVVPKDAINYHLNILNAMSKFAATIESLSAHADDPMGSVALLRTYNEAEIGMYTSFDALADYYVQKRL